MTLVSEIEKRLSCHRPRKRLLRPFLNRAAVALVFCDNDGDAQLLMIRRATRDGDPWSGHMAFPGGLMEPDDRHGFDVACRETDEEIGLKLQREGRYIGRLSELMTHFQLRRRAIIISPYVFEVERSIDLELNAEVDEVIWVPFDFLANRQNRQRMNWKVGRFMINLPCYRYRGRLIWGLSLKMIDELLDWVVR